MIMLPWIPAVPCIGRLMYQYADLPMDLADASQTLAAQSDWAGYFATVRERFKQQCVKLRQNTVEMGNGG